MSSRPRLVPLVVAIVMGGCLTAPAPGQEPAPEVVQPDLRVAGEHGLRVRLAGDSVVVGWITPEPRPGLLEALANGRPIARVETATGFVHRAAFAPANAPDVLLRYGSLDVPDDRHETFVSLRPPERPPVSITGADSLYVLGDTHGELDAVIAGLQAAGLIDEDRRWSGGRRHMVFAGDLTDRGPDVLGLLWLAYRLEREAAAAGGAVHIVLGNHELMVMMGDLRYVHPKELHIAELHGVAYDRMFHVRESVLGRWLASKPGIIRVDRALIAHGGLGPQYAGFGLTEYDDTLRTYTGEELFARWADLSYVPAIDSLAAAQRVDFFWHADSPFWHRAFVQTDTAGTLLDQVLRRMDSDLFVVGHTPVDVMEARYDDRLIPAHTPRFGAELLLLVREPEGYRRYRISAAGREPF
jgi:hypothetical protein